METPEPKKRKPNTGLRIFTPERLAKMIGRYESGASQKELARDFETTVATISKYVKKAGVHRPNKTPEDKRKEPGACKPSNKFPGPHIQQKVVSEGKKQTFRKDLAWAIQAAGLFLRTREAPFICPNDSAFFLYQQACDNPKDFMAKFAQIESRAENSKDSSKADKAAKLAISDIEEQLKALDDIGYNEISPRKEKPEEANFEPKDEPIKQPVESLPVSSVKAGPEVVEIPNEDLEIFRNLQVST